MGARNIRGRTFGGTYSKIGLRWQLHNSVNLLKTYKIVHLEWVNFIVYKLYHDKTIFYNTSFQNNIHQTVTLFESRDTQMVAGTRSLNRLRYKGKPRESRLPSFRQRVGKSGLIFVSREGFHKQISPCT